MDISGPVTAVAGAIATFAFFGGIALLMWIDSRNKKHDRELKHTERMKALELGQTLPDGEIARAGAELGRAWALGLIGLIVPPALIGIALGATALIFAQGNEFLHLPLSCVVWGICGLVSLVTVATCIGSLAYSRFSAKRHGQDRERRLHAAGEHAQERIQELVGRDD